MNIMKTFRFKCITAMAIVAICSVAVWVSASNVEIEETAQGANLTPVFYNSASENDSLVCSVANHAKPEILSEYTNSNGDLIITFKCDNCHTIGEQIMPKN